jgi:hypothetical protein
MDQLNAKMLESDPTLQQLVAAKEEISFLRGEIAAMQRLMATLAWKYAFGKAVINDSDARDVPGQVHVLRDEHKNRVLLWVGNKPLTPEEILRQATSLDEIEESVEDEGS